MQRRLVETNWSERVEANAGSIGSRATSGTVKAAPALGVQVARAAFLLLSVLSGCAVRAPHPDGIGPQVSLPERTVQRLISVWEQQLGRYIAQEGGGDPAVLSQARVLRSRDVLRPARITFDALDVDSQVPGRDGWDVEGVLIGKHSIGDRNWYVFLVGIVARRGYRPVSIEDIRLVAFAAQKGDLLWVVSAPDHLAVQRYWETFGRSAAIRFPGETDQFVMQADEDRAWVRELRSGADWLLRRNAEDSPAAGG